MKTNWQLRMALGALALLLAAPSAWAQRQIGRKLTTPHADRTLAIPKAAAGNDRTEASVYDPPMLAQAITAAKARSGWRAALIPARQTDFVFSTDPKGPRASLVPEHLSFVHDVAISGEGGPMLLTVLDPATAR